MGSAGPRAVDRRASWGKPCVHAVRYKRLLEQEQRFPTRELSPGPSRLVGEKKPPDQFGLKAHARGFPNHAATVFILQTQELGIFSPRQSGSPLDQSLMVRIVAAFIVMVNNMRSLTLIALHSNIIAMTKF